MSFTYYNGVHRYISKPLLLKITLSLCYRNGFVGIAFDVKPLRRHTQRDWQCVTFKKKPLVFDKMFNHNKCKVTKIM